MVDPWKKMGRRVDGPIEQPDRGRMSLSSHHLLAEAQVPVMPVAESILLGHPHTSLRITALAHPLFQDITDLGCTTNRVRCPSPSSTVRSTPPSRSWCRNRCRP